MSSRYANASCGWIRFGLNNIPRDPVDTKMGCSFYKSLFLSIVFERRQEIHSSIFGTVGWPMSWNTHSLMFGKQRHPRSRFKPKERVFQESVLHLQNHCRVLITFFASGKATIHPNPGTRTRLSHFPLCRWVFVIATIVLFLIAACIILPN